jgi:hypothetical protein
MSKKRQFSDEDMDKLEALIKESAFQSSALNEILMAIKGDANLGIEGIVAAQKRNEREAASIQETFNKKTLEIEESINNRIGEIEKTVKQINDWKNAVTLYLGIITSTKMWRFLLVSIGIFALIFLSIKYGFLNVWQYIKNLVL